MAHKLFAERLNKALDNIDVPEQREERIDALCKLLKIHRFQAESFIDGIIIPNEMLLTKMAQELEVTSEWLLGEE